jgi:hypothetical protein
MSLGGIGGGGDGGLPGLSSGGIFFGGLSPDGICIE